MQLNVPGVPIKLDETTVAPQLEIEAPVEITEVIVTGPPVLVSSEKPVPLSVTD